MDSQFSAEQQRYSENEISSRWGRALFSAVFDGGFASLGALGGYKVAEALTDSDCSQALMTGGGVALGLGVTAWLKRFATR